MPLCKKRTLSSKSSNQIISYNTRTFFEGLRLSRIFLLLTLLLSLSEARDNPFFPAEGVEDLAVTSNITKNFDPLKRAALTLPDSARVLKEVTIRYQNLDGSIGSRTLSLEHSVDWHLPIFVSQSYGSTEINQKRTVAKPVKRYEKIATFKEIVFFQSGKSMRIETDDKLLRHFMMIRPHRIVMDFERVTDFRSKTVNLKRAPYKNIRLGNHNGYYRAVVEVDGQYQYKVEFEEGAIMLRVY